MTKVAITVVAAVQCFKFSRLQTGADPVHFPLAWHLLELSPSRVYPVKQVYLATDPTF